MKKLTHLDGAGRARMVDVSGKKPARRTATASAVVSAAKDVIDALEGGGLPKGDAFAAARIAGILAAKKVPDLIPLCHGISVSSVSVDFRRKGPDSIEITAHAAAFDVTGVEMEAMTAASVAALTLYDMCKALDKGIVIGPVMLLEKTGGKSGTYRRPGP